ncbi:ATPase, T2SS/T4P/T4SS family [Fusobacterium simiae]|uniref:type IV pilus twitching motility protein PilT n=1 Tax=Fusobacterium TaxID=848 RepID=UPI00041A9F98|nr:MULTISPECIES: ATPase, T2SS/T4P/T4SS family [Fusobacterium]MDC7954639.1 ATPase, T2SS/T4P/T4SS family [Fusobacterium simiae]
MDIEKVFDYARENNISDIHLIEGENIYLRKNGEIILYDNSIIVSKDEILEICSGKIEEDFAYTDTKNERYRVNSFLTRGKLALVIRIINKEPIKLKGKFINKLIDEKILFLKDGLVLVTGITGSGKSTTLASIIEKFNENKNLKILTVEDPIEYIFENKKSLIIQRELGKDVGSFEKALKSSLRQDPDVIILGEIRDEESLYSALKLAETGHLVFSTLHTMNTVESVNRLISMVRSEKRDFVRGQLASVLRFVLSQELYRGKKTVPIFEVLNNTKAVANLILNNKLNQIPTLIESGIENFMITKTKYLKNLEIESD